MFPVELDTSILGRVADVRKAYEAEAFLSALSLALTLPDICGKRMHPENKSGDRYAAWFDKYVSPDYSDNDGCYFDGWDCYKLRCSFLHEGSNAPDERKDRRGYNIAQFRLFYKNPAVAIDGIQEMTEFHGNEVSRMHKIANLDLAKFVDSICEGAERFITENPALNDLCPLEGSETVFYQPILDFRNRPAGSDGCQNRD